MEDEGFGAHFDVYTVLDLPAVVREAVAGAGDGKGCLAGGIAENHVWLSAGTRLFIFRANSLHTLDLPTDESYERRIAFASANGDFACVAVSTSGAYRVWRRPLRQSGHEDGVLALAQEAVVECITGCPTGVLVSASDGSLTLLTVPSDPFAPIEQTPLTRQAGLVSALLGSFRRGRRVVGAPCAMAGGPDGRGSSQALLVRPDADLVLERWTLEPVPRFAGESPLAGRLRVEAGPGAARWAAVEVADVALDAAGGTLHVLALHSGPGEGGALLSLHALPAEAVGTLPPPRAALWTRELPPGALPVPELAAARLFLHAGRHRAEAAPFVVAPSAAVLPDGELCPARPGAFLAAGPLQLAGGAPHAALLHSRRGCLAALSVYESAAPSPAPSPSPRPAAPGTPHGPAAGGAPGDADGAAAHVLRLALERRGEAARAVARRSLEADPAGFARAAEALSRGLLEERAGRDERWAGAGPAPRGSALLERHLRDRVARHDALADALRGLPLPEAAAGALAEAGERLRAAAAARSVYNALAAAGEASGSDAPVRLVEEAMAEAARGREREWAATTTPVEIFFSEASRLEGALRPLPALPLRHPYSRPDLAPACAFAAASFGLALVRPAAVLPELGPGAGGVPRWAAAAWATEALQGLVSRALEAVAAPGADRDGLSRLVAELGAALVEALAAQGAEAAAGEARAAVVRALWQACRDAGRAMALAERCGDMAALVEVLEEGAAADPPLLTAAQAEGHEGEFLARHGPAFARPLCEHLLRSGRTDKLLACGRRPELAGEVERLVAARPGLRWIARLQAGRFADAGLDLAAFARPEAGRDGHRCGQLLAVGKLALLAGGGRAAGGPLPAALEAVAADLALCRAFRLACEAAEAAGVAPPDALPPPDELVRVCVDIAHADPAGPRRLLEAALQLYGGPAERVEGAEAAAGLRGVWREVVAVDAAVWRELAAAGELPDAAARARVEATLFFAACTGLADCGPAAPPLPLDALCDDADAGLAPGVGPWLRRAAAEARADARARFRPLSADALEAT